MLKFYLKKKKILFSLFSFKNINATGFKALEQGQEVEFTVAQGEKGVEAKVNNIFISKIYNLLLKK